MSSERSGLGKNQHSAKGDAEGEYQDEPARRGWLVIAQREGQHDRQRRTAQTRQERQPRIRPYAGAGRPVESAYRYGTSESRPKRSTRHAARVGARTSLCQRVTSARAMRAPSLLPSSALRLSALMRNWSTPSTRPAAVKMKISCSVDEHAYDQCHSCGATDRPRYRLTAITKPASPPNRVSRPNTSDSAIKASPKNTSQPHPTDIRQDKILDERLVRRQDRVSGHHARPAAQADGIGQVAARQSQGSSRTSAAFSTTSA